jgi:hypothetical protein
LLSSIVFRQRGSWKLDRQPGAVREQGRAFVFDLPIFSDCIYRQCAPLLGAVNRRGRYGVRGGCKDAANLKDVRRDEFLHPLIHVAACEVGTTWGAGSVPDTRHSSAPRPWRTVGGIQIKMGPQGSRTRSLLACPPLSLPCPARLSISGFVPQGRHGRQGACLPCPVRPPNVGFGPFGGRSDRPAE